MGKIAGIDLGTTYSALAVLNTLGKPEIIPNSEGERITPSAVFFDDQDANIIRVGIEAVNSRQLNPDRSVRWIKRHMGEPSFKKKIEDKDWSPEEISSLILKKLRNDCGSASEDISDVVISVPAHFDEVRRKATMDAGTLAGLNVVAIVNEPVAAALFYATTQNVSGRVMVYDLGGGTFDVTVLDVKGTEIDIVCSQGDHALGGIDFDRKVLELFEKAYREKYDVELIESEEDRAKFEDEAEDVKKTLSRRPVAKKIIYGPAGSLRLEITREQFEEAIAPLLARTDMLLDVVLEESNSAPQDINTVLLVGGSTRVPVVQEKLTERFGFEPTVAVNVDECVALGAAIHAGLTKMRVMPAGVSAGIAAGLKDVKLTDVCNHSYGTISAPYDQEMGRHVIANTIILKKNTPLPCESTQTFYTVAEGQTDLQVTVTQGEDSDPDFVNHIATEIFKMPEGRSANCPIKVTYSYDLNQRMHCKFEDVESGKTLEVEFSSGDDGALSKENVVRHADELQSFDVK
ncbi:Heat shock protein 70 [Anaerohalosphaera lusitana]|uniref:Heat shock protein 70 n=1 Tax=Anaerohalosphaera lusitana TaxID=1936003 RepID=A0A1U9NQH2_9BACT|nr:Hsp70 family protein [Anaerohalosphaera lusitana]AQT70159.1 Heat shock protein 70 [Anaerohalosphaera lusitana]